MRERLHTLVSFDTDIFALRTGVLAMAELADSQFRGAIQALRQRDLALAADVLAGEREINAMHLSLDEACVRVIARHQPTAVDLREVVGVLHSIGDLERIGDEAKKIAGKVPRLGDVAAVLVERVASLAAMASTMIQRAGDAYRHRDPSIAAVLHELDDRVDAERDRLVAELTSDIERCATSQGGQTTESLLDMVLIVQSIERVADHAEDIAEYVVAIAVGVDRRHGDLP
jgi:phosphate transport system protein